MPEKTSGKAFKTTAYGKYFLLERLAVGGMAEVFKAKTFGVRGFERLLVIKRILPHLSRDEDFVEMFIDEAKISVELSHANIVQVTDLGKIGDNFFIAMEYIDGKDLRAILKRAMQTERFLSVEQATYIAIEICKGLDYAHRKKSSTTNKPLNIIHRDISPQNIMISYEGDVKIVDFGIAKTASKLNQTQAGVLKGKFGYMSPEQAQGLEVDQKTDIFSAGIILFEMLTGRRLFLGETDFETLEKIKEAKIPLPSLFNKKIPKELDRITLKALTKDLDKRYHTIKELQVDLTRFFYSAYPDFTAANLSSHLKKLFKEDIKEERRRLKQALETLPIDGLIDSELASHADGQVVDSQEDPTYKIASQKKVISKEDIAKLDLEPLASVSRPKSSFLRSFSFYEKTIGRIFQRQKSSGKSIGDFLSANKYLIIGSVFLIFFVAMLVKFLFLPGDKPIRPKRPATLKKEFSVQTEPAGAKLFVNENYVGVTPVTAKLPLKEFLKLEFRKEGFEPLVKRLFLNTEDQANQIFRLEPAPAIPMTSLRVTSKPEKASIWLNGKDTTLTTPSTISNLKSGDEITVGLKLKGYSDLTKTLTLGPDETNELNLVLKPLSAHLKVTTSPPGAKIWLEGFRERKSPVTFRDLKRDKTYKITIYKSGYKRINSKVRIKDLSEKRTYNLAKIIKYYGYLSLNAIPYAEVILDGKLIGYTPRTNLKLSTGTHTIRFKHPAAPSITRKVTIKKGQTQTVIVEMKVRD